METTYKIQSPTRSDKSEIVDLLRSSDLIAEGLDDTQFWVVKEGGKILACIGLEEWDRDGLLRSLAVEKNHRNSGLGSSLVLYLIGLARERKIGNLYLLTITAKDYFPRFGFIPVDRSEVKGKRISNSREFEQCSETSALMKLAVLV